MYNMPDYKNSKSQKKSQSKNGGRRRKHTMRKLRRGRKSRKVMRGGAGNDYTRKFPGGSNLVADILTNNKSITDKNSLEDYVYGPNFNAKNAYKDLFGVIAPDDKDIKEDIVEFLDSGGIKTPLPKQ